MHNCLTHSVVNRRFMPLHFCLPGLHMRNVDVSASGIGHEIEVVLLVRPRHDQIVDNPPVLVREDGEGTLIKHNTSIFSFNRVDFRLGRPDWASNFERRPHKGSP